jgi:GntR family transcriptional repressor for pyruvate dehydrogenase complex
MSAGILVLAANRTQPMPVTDPSTTPQAIRHLGPPDRQRMRDRVVEMLIDAIRAGAYGEGDRLPSERELAAEIGVSRAIVSDAVDELQESGVLESRRGRGGGTFVVSVSKMPARTQRVPGERKQVMAWLLDAREAIEIAVVLLASDRARMSDLREMRKLYDQMAELLDDSDAYAEAAMRFNMRIAEACGNPFLMEFVRQLVNEQAALRREFTDNPAPDELREKSLAAHAETLDALADGDPDRIAKAVESHMAGVRDIYFGARDEDSGEVSLSSLIARRRD